MAINKSNENTRIARFTAMSPEDLANLCLVNINNTAICKQFVTESSFNWDYMVAAGLITWDDAKWLKENKPDSEPEPIGEQI